MQNKSNPSRLCSLLAPRGTDAGWCQEVREAEKPARLAVGELRFGASACQASIPGLQRDSPGISAAWPGGALARESFNAEHSEVHHWEC